MAKAKKPAKKPKTRKLWLARDHWEGSLYELFPKKPVKKGGVYYSSVGAERLFRFCKHAFERLCSIRVAPGECVAVEFSDPFQVVK